MNQRIGSTEPNSSFESSESQGITVDGLAKTYGEGDTAVNAVKDVSLEMSVGDVVGILGPNGAGKTTLIKCILGTILPDAGEIEVAGIDMRSEPREAYERIGAMFEGGRNAYWRLTVRENLEFYDRLMGRSAADRRGRHDELLDNFDLREKADVPVRKLSRGMRQKVSLITAILQARDVVFLDEPTLGLDLETSITLQEELQRLVEEESLTVVLSSHDMDVVQDLCDRVVIMQDGEVVRDEAVGDLLGSVQNTSFRVRLSKPVSREGIKVLDQRFDVQDRTEYDGILQIDIGTLDRSFYDLTNTLEEQGCTVDSIETLSGNLDEIFLELTGEME